MKKLDPYLKTVYAFIVTAIGSVITAVAATPNESLRELGTLGWLILIGTIVGVPATVYAVPNKKAS